MTSNRRAWFLAGIAALVLVASPVHAEEDGETGSASSDPSGGDGGGDSGPCEIIVYDPSDPGTFLVDPDGCIWSILDDLPGE